MNNIKHYTCFWMYLLGCNRESFKNVLRWILNEEESPKMCSFHIYI